MRRRRGQEKSNGLNDGEKVKNKMKKVNITNFPTPAAAQFAFANPGFYRSLPASHHPVRDAPLAFPAVLAQTHSPEVVAKATRLEVNLQRFFFEQTKKKKKNNSFSLFTCQFSAHSGKRRCQRLQLLVSVVKGPVTVSYLRSQIIDLGLLLNKLFLFLKTTAKEKEQNEE